MSFNVRTVLILTLVFCNNLECNSKEEEIVETWAAKLGEELWQLGLSVTKMQEIKTSYKKLNARVLPTDGEGILNTIVLNVNKLLKRKMDSVMCVIKAAEELAKDYAENNETYIYFSSKFSNGLGVELEPPVEGVNESFYKEMRLGPDYHFYQIRVNTNHSAVHVPTDVYDQGRLVKFGLQWSDGLDDVFRNNYLADPTMSWQYFGSSSGFLRHYPALHWTGVNKDVFDCRTRFWYIEAATCSKDILVLVDNSGSMYGMSNTIARLTVATILETFSSNDFINIFSFNMTIKNIVPCFPSDLLVQATPENINLFKTAVNKLVPDDKANFTSALEFALKVLQKNRENKTCPDNICNQAIMLVTDGLPDNVTKVFEKYNWFENRTRIPVRLFIYVIGREVFFMKETDYITCMNRGLMVQIKSLEEVRSQVLKYISVIARPMVLQAVEHPLSWTHSFLDATGKLTKDPSDDHFRFMTSVSGPAFDTEANNINGSRKADLLGVAGTDVLIKDIISLTLPYKIGANGYAFVITNNGYALFHPDLRPVFRGHLKHNYNSIDLTEVELLDDNIEEPRNPSLEILKLREAMVSNNEGNMTGLKIKFHYDHMRRVGVEIRNYYFAQLNNTPFTMGLVLPDSYGDHWIKAGDEILKSKQRGINITEYFKGNWRIHPAWTYCDYHWSSTVRSFNSSEEKLLSFLAMISSQNWQWKERFSEDDELEDDTENCARPSVAHDDYFCDKELMQLLVFDAKITQASYKTVNWEAKDRGEAELVARFNASLRFVATQSGLTRWQSIPSTEKSSFGDTNNQALNEVWYRSAVLHHHLDHEAFVFSVPFDSGPEESIKVTASHAIFPRDGGNEAPGSVVGFQIEHSALYRRFMEITSKPNCQDCSTSCESDELDCYVIDGSGYIVLSEIKNDTGRFFGDVEGAVMEAMIKKNIFRHVLIFDYQATCVYDLPVKAAANLILTPFRVLYNVIQWMISHIIWTLVENRFYVGVGAEEDDDYYDEIGAEDLSEQRNESNENVSPKEEEPSYYFEDCDQKGYLYLLQHLSKEGYHSAVPVNCSRPFYVKRIPHTNLLLIVVNALHQSCYRKVSARMEKVVFNSSFDESSCQKLNLNSLPRRKLPGCFNYHPLEDELVQCSGSERSITGSAITVLFASLLSVLFSNRHLNIF